ncbi:lytic transglycosylase domain-containing protein [Sphingopyxis sp. 550A]
MAALKGILALAMTVVGVRASAVVRSDAVSQWTPYIAEASARFGIPAPWIERVMRAESGGHTTLNGRAIRSRVGAMGLMQLMPATWAAMRDTYRLGSNPDDPHDNIIAGTAYLRLMADRFGYPGLFAAYNAGPGRYAAYLAGRSHLPGETIAYIGGITGHARMTPATVAASPRELLFVLRRDLGDAPRTVPDKAQNDPMFAIKRSDP